MSTPNPLDAYTAVKLSDLLLLKLQAQTMAELLRVLTRPTAGFMERTIAKSQTRDVLARFDGTVDILTGVSK